MPNEIYNSSLWGSPQEVGWGSIYYAFSKGGDTTSFITTWRTTSLNETITIPTGSGVYNYDISTSDGQNFTGVAGNQTITFGAAGDYDISISGTFPQIFFNNSGDKDKLIKVKQWGNIAWGSSQNKAFYGVSNCDWTATDFPNWSNVTRMSGTFRSSSFNGNLTNWDFSNVTRIDVAFFGSSSYTGVGLGSIDVGSVTNFSLAIRDTNVDQNLSSWDITSATNFTSFAQNTTFSTSNYDAILIGWEATLQAAFPNGSGYTPSISINFGNSEYNGGGAAEAARTSLINTFNWTITDGGLA